MKVAIIGGGFSGLIFASKLLEAGVDVTLFEEHLAVGYPPHCTGLVSSRVLGLIGAPAFKSVVARFNGIRLSSGVHDVKLSVRGGIVKLDRVKLEQLMLEDAESKGLRVVLGVRVKRVSPRGVVEASDTGYYDAVVLAEGYYGLLRRNLNIGFRGAPVYGVNAEYQARLEIRGVTVLFNDSISRGFFSWIVGLKDRVLVGLGVRDPGGLAKGLRKLEAKLGLKGRISVYGGPVITGPPGERLSLGRVHVVGDAAGLNKPLTGGGLYPNSLAATLASKLILNGLEVNEALHKSVSLVAGMLRRQYKLAKAILEEGVARELIEIAYKTRIAEKLGGVDYDHHELVVVELLKRAPLEGVGLALGTLINKPHVVKHLITGLL